MATFNRELDRSTTSVINTGTEAVLREDGTYTQRVLGRPYMDINCVYRGMTKAESDAEYALTKTNAGKDVTLIYLEQELTGRIISTVVRQYEVHYYSLTFIFRTTSL